MLPELKEFLTNGNVLKELNDVSIEKCKDFKLLFLNK